MKQIVFFSWQSDLPNSCNRGFIQRALEGAAATIKADETVEIEPVVDRDTEGVPGSPDIASTIFAKITAADAFVADVSITNRGDKRATPNPNVLIELGYALKALGHERVILVFNRAFGKVEELPFDLRARRVLVYDMPEAAQKAPERNALERQLESAVRAALPAISGLARPLIPAVSAIETQQPNRIIIIRRNLDEILKKLVDLQPKKDSEGGMVDDLIGALNLTEETVAEFSKIAEVISVMNEPDAGLEVHRWFGRIFERYDLPEGFFGRFSDADFDYFKFLGHELFTTYIGFLLREQRWDSLEALAAEPIPVRYLNRERGPGSVNQSFASQPVMALYNESRRRNHVAFWLHAEILKDRHKPEGPITIMPFDEFMAADYLLFLLGEVPHPTAGAGLEWRPWSALHLKRPPMFLRNAENQRAALRLIKLFRISTLDEFRTRLAQRTPIIEKLFQTPFWTNPLQPEDINRIGTR